MLAGALLATVGCSPHQPASTATTPSASPVSTLAPAQPSATTTTILGPFPMGAKATFPDGVGVQVVTFHPVGHTKVSFVLEISNGSTKPIAATDFIAVTPGDDLDADGYPVVHVLGTKPQWPTLILPGRSAGEVFVATARGSALADIAVIFDGFNHTGPDESVPVVFRGSLRG